VLQDRDYVRLEDRRFIPQEIGMVVHKLLRDHFTQYVDYQFTAKIEEDFDNVARGKEDWKLVVRKFWDPFSDLLKAKNTEVKKSDIVSEPTDETCPECGEQLVIRLGPYSRFLACTGYPKCRYTKPLENGQDPTEGAQQESDVVCEQCGRPMMVKRGRYGTFLGCSGYPECKNTSRLGSGGKGEPQVVDQKCEKCGTGLVIRKNRFGKLFLACPNYPKCTYATSYKQKAAS
jgi:DNA topoisomerase-1